jgi:hypothetical protein
MNFMLSELDLAASTYLYQHYLVKSRLAFLPQDLELGVPAQIFNRSLIGFQQHLGALVSEVLPNQLHDFA